MKVINHQKIDFFPLMFKFIMHKSNSKCTLEVKTHKHFFKKITTKVVCCTLCSDPGQTGMVGVERIIDGELLAVLYNILNFLTFTPLLIVLQNLYNSTYSNLTLLYLCQQEDRLFLSSSLFSSVVASWGDWLFLWQQDYCQSR